ncbi:hypothetical protein M409DRAFT_27158 [Zasmidium cellare ATCC 36951]|uniref:NmrA-like domain-containing protein n=1 Tax=Zasmidium cellare ATCC 36951 TaxID=1080233 RepID=A0A6A6C684_ZASCE|nr:uncharacterized protein M409DRAFT_27158 [Zasmidium cellare ATCC 36951]KAF2162535.1 hypothetical protein M409DRAFT_27158 [Zasmidium cellare ATCC 36951]
MAKLLVVIGATGTQGSSVLKAFLGRPGVKLRGVTRNRDGPQSKFWEDKGVEMVQADIADADALQAAVQGASIVFANTAYPSQMAMQPQMQQRAYEVELQHGRDIVDAVSRVETLELFIWSSLSAASKHSGGTYRKVWHFGSKARVVDYIQEVHPRLAAKMSILQMGLFVDNWMHGPIFVPWEKASDESKMLRIPGDGDCPIPFAVPQDAGKYVLALMNLPVKTNLLAFSDRITWEEYVALWSKITGVSAKLIRTSVAEHSRLDRNRGFAEEIGEMYGYLGDFGYHGGDPSVTFSATVQMELSPTSLEDYIRNEDWSPLLSR